MASRARAPGNAGLVRRPKTIAHDYSPNDPEATCLSNLSTRLYVTLKAGEDWHRWAATVGNPVIIKAVNDALGALNAAHREATKELRRKAKEDGHNGD